MAKQISTILMKDLPIKQTSITDDDYVVISSGGTKKLKIKDITKEVEKKAADLEEKTTELGSQLEQKLDKNGIVTLANMGQDVKEAMTGGSVAVVGINSIGKENLKQNCVDYNNTKFIKSGKNLFNKKSIIKNKLINNAGQLIEWDGYSVSDFVYLNVGQYTVSEVRKIALYTLQEAFIKLVDCTALCVSTTLDIEEPCLARILIQDGASGVSRVDIAQVELGNEVTDYEEFYLKIENLKYDEKKEVENDFIIEIDDCSFMKKNNYFNIDDTANTFGVYIDIKNGEEKVNEYYSASDYIKLKKEKYQFTNVRNICFYDENKTFVKGMNLANNGASQIVDIDSDYFIRVSYYNDRNVMILKSDIIIDENRRHGYYIKELIIKEENLKEISEKFEKDENLLKGKILAVTGDSICKGDGYLGGYGKIIAERNDMELFNYGRSGSTVAKIDGYISILESIDNMTSEADYILLEGGTNDSGRSNNVSLGEITEGYNEVFDEYTFSGAMESMLKKSIQKWPGKKIIFITVHNMGSRPYLKKYMDRAKEICEKWSIPYVDLFSKSGLNTNLEEIANLFTAHTYEEGVGDKTHPNEEGYTKFYVPPIESFMKKLSI